MTEQTINEVEAKRLLGWIFEMKDQNKMREEKIKALKARNLQLVDAVEEFQDNSRQMDELKGEVRDNIKLLNTLVQFAEKSSGKEFVDDGPLYKNGGENN